MSRVHDALRKAEQLLEAPEDQVSPDAEAESRSLVVPEEGEVAEKPPTIEVPMDTSPKGMTRADRRELQVDWRNFLSRCKTIPFKPAPEAHLINVERPHEVPGEEFRTLRT